MIVMGKGMVLNMYLLKDQQCIICDHIEEKGIYILEQNEVTEDMKAKIHSAYDHIFENKTNRYESHMDEDVIVFQLSEKEKKSLVYLFLKQDYSVIVGSNKTDIRNILRIIENRESKIDLDYLVGEMLHKLAYGNAQHILHIEEQFSDLENQIMNHDIKADISKKILKFRRGLLMIKRLNDDLMDIVDGVVENGNNFFNSSFTYRFEILQDRFNRNYSYTESLLDYAIEIREAYQSEVSAKQNELMQFFTLISAFFLPLSLITGWYGMTFSTTPLTWEIGYIVVGLMFFITVIGAVVYFRRKKWM